MLDLTRIDWGQALDLNAARVAAICAVSAPRPGADVGELRRLYAARRRPLQLEPLDIADYDVETISVDGRKLDLHIYRPFDSGEQKRRKPALIYFHGGGWVFGGIDTYDALCRQFARLLNRVVIFVDYRLAPEHRFPSAVEDSIAACLWVAHQAETLGFDFSDIAIAGDSAGGNIAAVSALCLRDMGLPQLLSGQLLIYPCIDLTAGTKSHFELAEGYLLTRQIYLWYVDQYLADPREAADWRASPGRAKNLSGLPPAVVVTAGFDPLRDEGTAYAARLEASGVPTIHLRYGSMIHGFVNMAGAIPAAGRAVGEILEQFDRHICRQRAVPDSPKLSLAAAYF